MEATKVGNLRVRITSAHREILEHLVKNRNQGENLSDVVRYLIAQAGAEDNSSDRVTTPLSSEIAALLIKLGREVDRSPQQILEECVRGIAAMVGGDTRPPLITEEIRLRRRYKSEPEQSNTLAEPLPGLGTS